MLVARFNTDVRCTEHNTNVEIGNGTSQYNEVASNCQIVSFTVGDVAVYVFIDILHLLIVVAGSR